MLYFSSTVFIMHISIILTLKVLISCIQLTKVTMSLSP